MRDFTKDLWTTLRSLARQPGLSLVVVLTLALGIGASTALFAYLTYTLWPTVDAPQPERIAWVWAGTPEEPERISSYPEYRELRRQQAAVSLSAFSMLGASVGHGQETTYAWGRAVDGGYFSLLGARAAAGRLLQPADDQPGAPPVVVLSHFFWKRVLGGDPAVVGRGLRINGLSFQVVGIAPEGFRDFGSSAALYLPLIQTDRVTGIPRLEDPDSRWLSLVGRLAPGVGRGQALAVLAGAGRALDRSLPLPGAKRQLSLQPVTSYAPSSEGERYVGAARILMAAAGLFLFLACANVANLFLARATARQREWGLRATLGASRGRLIARAFTESLILCLAGGIAGLGIAALLMRRIEAYLHTALGGLGSISEGSSLMRLDARGFAFALLVAVACALLCGLAPMLHVLRGDLLASVKADSGGTASQAGGLTLRRLLVVLQVGLSALLLLGGSLLVRSLRNAERTDPGFDARNLLYTTLYVPRSAAGVGNTGSAYPRIQEMAARLPGVRGATLVQMPPLAGWSRTTRLTSRERPDRWQDAALNIVGPGFFSTMGIPVLRGRAVDARDRKDTAPAVVVNQALARKLWGDADPVGRFLTSGEAPRAGELGPDFQVVGVAKDVRMTSVVTPPEPAIYYVYDQHRHSRMTLVVRTAVPPSTLLPSLRAAARSAHPDLAFVDVTTSDEQMRRSLGEQRMYAEIASLLGLLGLAVAVLGLFGLLSYTVSLRVREFGIRMAIGAHPDDVLKLVLRQGLGLVAAGVILGLAGALALTRLLRGLLFGVAADDPTTFGIVAAILTFVALLACYLPAQRASQLDPLSALRRT